MNYREWAIELEKRSATRTTVWGHMLLDHPDSIYEGFSGLWYSHIDAHNGAEGWSGRP